MLKTLARMMESGKEALSQIEIRIEREGLSINLRLVLPLTFLIYAVAFYLLRSFG